MIVQVPVKVTRGPQCGTLDRAVRYTDRGHAGRELGRLLEADPPAGAVVLALARGGVPVGAEVAAALGVVLDVVVVRKIGLPGQPEVGVGAVTEDGVVLFDEELLRRLAMTPASLAPVVAAELAEVARRVAVYRAGRPAAELAGRTAVVVDDGVARGVTALAAVRTVRVRGAAAVVLAVPVASVEGMRRVAAECDAVVCPEVLHHFGAVGRYYRDFGQVADEEVRAALTASS
jgi:putative phosphoribosyl transferase